MSTTLIAILASAILTTLMATGTLSRHHALLALGASAIGASAMAAYAVWATRDTGIKLTHKEPPK